METCPYASARENEARSFLAGWSNPAAHGVKCWYCDVDNIAKGSDILLIGLSPGGDENARRLDEENDYLKLPYTKRGFNSWLDENWLGKGPKHQQAMWRVFQTMFPQDWESKLRSSACTNVFPIRTGSVDAIDSDGWAFAETWFQKIMGHVQPKIVICNGNSNQNSAWSYLCKNFGCSLVREIDIGAKGKVKLGSFNTGVECKVLGLPSLSRFARESLFQAIETVGPF
ncbi:MAG TPA: hypothetical protein VN283_04825 [Thiobacillus sp.]|nr:hypothetical protein [Thiobacillus sp.]